MVAGLHQGRRAGARTFRTVGQAGRLRGMQLHPLTRARRFALLTGRRELPAGGSAIRRQG